MITCLLAWDLHRYTYFCRCPTFYLLKHLGCRLHLGCHITPLANDSVNMEGIEWYNGMREERGGSGHVKWR
jgi:hypothetical protein